MIRIIGYSFLLMLLCVQSAAFALEVHADDIIDVTFIGAIGDDNIGKNLGVAGDIDGDGFGDLLLGTDACVSCRNIAYVISGSTNLPSNVDLGQPTHVKVIATDFSTEVAVAGLGDFNGDGYDDMILGDGLSRSTAGRAFIFFGSEIMPTTFSMNNPSVPGVMVEGGGQSGFFGFVVSAAGDVNGDGFADALVSAPAQYSSDTIREAFLIYGGTDVPSLLNSSNLGVHGILLRDAYPLSDFGFSLSHAGDVNRDGFGDFLIGTRVYNPGSAPERAYLVYGGTDLPGVIEAENLGLHGIEFTTAGFDTGFGSNVSGGGDIDGDGYDDILIAAVNAEVNGVYRAGRINVIFGGPDLPQMIDVDNLSKYGIVINGFEERARLGEGLGGPGFINGDSYADLILSSPQGSEKVSLVFGNPNFQNYHERSIQNLDRILITDRDGDMLGSSEAFLGDINGDGKSDLMLGARFALGTKGAAYVIYNTSERFESIAQKADVNDDGIVDYKDLLLFQGQWQQESTK